MLKLKSCFKRISQFESFYSVGFNIEICSDSDHIISHYSSDDENCLVVVNSTNCKILHKIIEEEKITSFTCCPNEEACIICNSNLVLKKWNWKTNELIRSWNSYHTQPVLTMAMDTSGKRLVTGSADHILRLWHVGPGEGLTFSCRGHKDRVTFVKFHPHNTMVLSSAGTDPAIRLWNTETGVQAGQLDGHQSPVTDAAWFHRSQLVSCARDSVLLLWCLKEMKLLRKIPSPEIVECCFLLPSPGHLHNTLDEDAPHLLTAGESGVLSVWNLHTARRAMELRRTDITPLETSYSLSSVVRMLPLSDHQLLVVRSNANLEFYNSKTIKIEKEWSCDLGEVRDIIFCVESGNLLVAEASPLLRLYRLRPGDSGECDEVGWSCSVTMAHEDGVLCVAAAGGLVSSGGKDRTARIWSVESSPGDLPGRLRLHAEALGHSAHVSAVAMDSQTRYLATGDEEGSVRTWKIDKTESSETLPLECISTLSAHSSIVNHMCVSANDKLLASSSKDRSVRLWSLPHLQSLAHITGHSRGVWCSDFSPVEKKLVTCSGDASIKLWNLDDLSSVSCLCTVQDHECPVYRVLFITHGRQLLSTDQMGIVRLWSLQGSSISCVRSLDAHVGRVWALTVDGEDKRFVTGGEDARLCVWLDVTEKEAADRQAARAQNIQMEQELSDLLRAHRYARALQVAVELDKPQRALSVLEEMEWMEEEDRDKHLTTALDQLTEPQLRRLVVYSLHWNSNARVFWVAQKIVHHVVSNMTPQQLIQWPESRRLVKEFVSFSERHHRRLEGLAGQLTYLNLLIESMRSNPLSAEVIPESNGADIHMPDANTA